MLKIANEIRLSNKKLEKHPGQNASKIEVLNLLQKCIEKSHDAK